MSETRTIKYAVLFNLSVQLQGYKDVALNDILIVPDQATGALFNDLRILFKSQNDSYTALVEVGSTGVFKDCTLINIPDTVVFSFYLTFKNPSFQTGRSNLSSYNLEASLLALTNATHHRVSGMSYLTKEVPAYNAAEAYRKGYFSSQSGHTYLALQDSGPGNVHDVLQNTYWKQITGVPYAGQQDLRTRDAIDPKPASAAGILQISNSPLIHADECLLDRLTVTADGVSYPVQKPKQPTYNIVFKNNTTT